MRLFVCVLAIFCLLVASDVQASGPANESQCPAHQAAEQGASTFHEFHAVMAPAWHTAYPEKDYDALIAVAPKFAEQFEAVEAMKPKLTNEHKLAYFKDCREKFGKIIAEYAAAAEAGEKEKVYEMMPSVHDAFERTAAALLPVHYKEFDAFLVTLGLITEDHLPNNNEEGIIGSTETLQTKAATLTEESLPFELAWSKEEVMPQLQRFQQLAAEMKKCCDNNDMGAYRENAETLQAEATAFAGKYL